MGEMLYCENEDCRVELYRTMPGGVDVYRPLPNGDLQVEPMDLENCPGCGRFGRAKGK